MEKIPREISKFEHRRQYCSNISQFNARFTQRSKGRQRLNAPEFFTRDMDQHSDLDMVYNELATISIKRIMNKQHTSSVSRTKKMKRDINRARKHVMRNVK